MPTPISDAEAKEMHDKIQEDIAKEKGIKTDVPAEEDKPEVDKEEDKEPASKDESDADKSDDADEALEDVDPEKPRSRHIPLSKYQELKRQAKETEATKDAEIATLKSQLESKSTFEQMEGDIKAYAEKHGMSEDAVKDLLPMLEKAFNKDKTVAPVLQKAELFIKKQEAQEAFDNEFSDLLGEFPEAAEVKARIREEAYKDKHLDKSLYEIYLRYVRPPAVPKKKTGESSRGSVRNDSKEPDFDKIIENVKNNVPGALNNLSSKEIDALFEKMGKEGSRYSR